MYKQLEDKSMDHGQAAQMNNAADKMIKIVSLQASYTHQDEIKNLDLLK
jgi:hypothetical protein